MDASQLSADTPSLPADALPERPPRRRKAVPRTRAELSRTQQADRDKQPLSRDELDGRTKAAQRFDAIAEGIAADLGGEASLSTVQKHLVEAFAGAALRVQDLNTHLLLGQDVDVLEHCQVVSSLVRIASRIGVRRLAKDVIEPSLAEYLEHINKQPTGEEAAS